MRILCVGGSISDTMGGAPRASVESMMALADLGYQVSYFTLGQSKQTLAGNHNHTLLQSKMISIKNYSCSFENVYGIVGIRKFLRALREARSLKPDIIFINQIYTSATILGWLVSKSVNAPFIIVPHGSLTFYHESKSVMRKRVVRKLVLDKVLSDSKLIFTTSEKESKEIPHVLNSKVCNVGLGIQLSKKADQSNPISKDMKQILCIGRLTKKKNFGLVIQALSILKREGHDLQLYIAGDGEESVRQELIELALKLRVLESVKFLGWVNDSEKSNLFDNCFVSVLPSDEENFAITVAESMAGGLPCIVSKEVALSKIVEEYRAGLVLKENSSDSIAESIEEIISMDPNLLYKNSITASSNLSWTSVSEAWDREIRKIIISRTTI